VKLEEAKVVEHQDIQGGYRLLVMAAPGIASEVKPGQFVHVRVPHLGESILRRPFSVFRVEQDRLSILYKDVGRGTRTLQYLRPGEAISLIGPLGHGFPGLSEGHFPVIVAGGYGMAALYLTAKTLPVKGVAFFGGRSARDILCVKDFQALGWDVRVTTEDGSLGTKGIVTVALDAWWNGEGEGRKPEMFACGPTGMLRAVSKRAIEKGWRAWVSVDEKMGCGVGACLTCVVKIRTDEPDGWKWQRSCREGPVFECREIVWESEAAAGS
jgi:dihydroorotate dehydrogenase electron transfer subunit